MKHFSEIVKGITEGKIPPTKNQQNDGIDTSVDHTTIAKNSSKAVRDLEIKQSELDAGGKEKDAEKMQDQINSAHEDAGTAHHTAMMFHRQKQQAYQSELDNMNTSNDTAEKNIKNMIKFHGDLADEHRASKHFHNKMATF